MRFHVYRLILFLLFLSCAVSFAQDQSGAGPHGMQFSNFSSGGGGCNCSSLVVSGSTQIFGGPVLINPPPSPSNTMTNMNVNGVINVMAYGATGGGTTDDTNAIQAAINAAGATKCVYFPAGTYLVSSADLNLTSNSQTRCIEGEDPTVSKILCEDTGGNCVDFSGSDGFSARNLQILGGTSAANAPKVLLLLARTSNAQGFGHVLQNVWMQTYGTYTIYDYGAEMGFWYNIRSNTPSVMISTCNSKSMSSHYQSLVAPATSMSMIQVYGGNWNGGGGGSVDSRKCAVYLDDGCTNGVIHDVGFYGAFFGEFAGGGSAICDMPGGSNNSIDFLGVYNSRMEASDTSSNYSYIDFRNSYSSGLKLYGDNIGTTAALTQPVLNFFPNYTDSDVLDVVPQGGLMAAGTLTIAAGGGRGNMILNTPKSQVSAQMINPSGDPGSAGNFFQWSAGGLGYVDAGGAAVNDTTTTLTGTTAGSVTWSQPMHGTGYKLVVLSFQGYENTTATGQHIVYPVTYLSNPTFYGSCPPSFTTDGAQAYLPPNMTAVFTGQCMVGGS